MAEKTRPPRTRNAEQTASTGAGGNPVWFKPVMLGFMIVGLVWIIVYYIGATSVPFSIPIPAVGAWNILIGFAIALVGFLMTTRWK